MSEGVCCSRRRVLAQQHQAGKMFIISEFPGQEAANSRGFPVFPNCHNSGQVLFLFSVLHKKVPFFLIYIYLLTSLRTGLIARLPKAHEGPSHKSQGFNGRTPVAKQRLRRAKQMPAECNGTRIHFNWFGCGQKRQVLQGLRLLG